MARAALKYYKLCMFNDNLCREVNLLIAKDLHMEFGSHFFVLTNRPSYPTE